VHDEIPSQDVRIGKIIGELLDRRARGEQISEEQVVAEHPDIADEIRKELRAAEVLLRGRAGDLPVAELLSIPEDSFPGYQILGEAHRGGQGVVLKAIQKATRRRVAIKVMRDSLFTGSSDDPRFNREVQILGALKHPRIVTIHDSGVANGRRYLVMDYIAGQPLDVWNASRSRPIRETLSLFVKICEAINAAHLKGIIHRDLKPSNIRVDSAGEPHILDFGLAKIGPASLEDSSFQTMTETGQFLGSVPWASPEQTLGDPNRIDTRTDVYSLGVILFQLLTGRFPYDVVGPMRDVLDRISNAEPIRPSSLCKEIDDEVETIILKCLRKEPERRYQTAGELGRDVQRYLDGEPIEAKRDSTLYVLKKTLHRHRTAVGVAIAFAVLVAASLVLSTSLWRQAVAEKNRALAAERDQAAQRARADLAARQADQARQVAERRQEQLEEQAEHLAHTVYTSRITMAQNACTSNEFNQALAFLDDCAPERRAWEWHYLRRLATPQHISAIQMPTAHPRVGDEDLANALCLSTDGRRLAVVGADEIIRIADALTGQAWPIPGQYDDHTIVRFDSTGSSLAIATKRPDSGTVRMWDLRGNVPRLAWERTFDWPAEAPGRQTSATSCSLAISLDGSRVAFGFQPAGLFIIAADGSETVAITNSDLGSFTALSFSPDGRKLACGDQDRTQNARISIWNTSTGEQLTVFDAHASSIRCLAWSPDGRWIASGSRIPASMSEAEGSLKVFDSQTGQVIMSTRGHDGFVTTVAFSPDGTLLASGGSRLIPYASSPDRTLAVWDVQTGQQRNMYSAHAGGAVAVQWAPSGQEVLSIGWDGVLKRWALHERQASRTLRGHAGMILQLAFSPDGRQLVSCGATASGADKHPIRVWDVQSGELVLAIPFGRNVYRAVYTPDGREIITTGTDRTIQFWNSQTGRKESSIEGWASLVSDLTISSDGQLLACACGTRITVFRLPDRSPHREFNTEDQTRSVAFSPDGRWLAAATHQGAVHIWDCHSQFESRILRAGQVLRLARFSPDSRLIAAASANQEMPFIGLWDVHSGKELGRLTLPLKPGQDLDFSPDGRRIASVGADCLLRIWDPQAHAQVFTTRASDSIVSAVAFSPDGNLIATAGKDGLIRLWDATPISEAEPSASAPADPAEARPDATELRPDNGA